MVAAPRKTPPRITLKLIPRAATPLQRRLAARDVVIYSAWQSGYSNRLIAQAFGIDPAVVRRTIRRFEAIEE